MDALAVARPWWQGLQYMFFAWLVYGMVMTMINPHCAFRNACHWLRSDPEQSTLVEDPESQVLIRT